MADDRIPDDEIIAFLKSEGVSDLIVARFKRAARGRGLGYQAMLEHMVQDYERAPEADKRDVRRRVLQRRLQATKRTP